MNPPLLTEPLAAEHRRELVEEAARARIAAAIVGTRRGPLWGPIRTVLRRLAGAPVTPRGSEELNPQLALVEGV
jgi:hypothetical protein